MAQPWKRLAKAQEAGVLIIDAAQFAHLLATGELPVPVQAPVELPVEDAPVEAEGTAFAEVPAASR